MSSLLDENESFLHSEAYDKRDRFVDAKIIKISFVKCIQFPTLKYDLVS